MASTPQATRRADLEGSNEAIGLREVLNELVKESKPPLLNTLSAGKSISTSSSVTNGQRRCLALTSHPPSSNLQYLSLPIPPVIGFILTSPHRKPRDDTDPEGKYSTLPFSKQSLLVELLGVIHPDGNPDFESRRSPVQHLEVDLFRPVNTIAKQETRLERVRRLLDGAVDDHLSGNEPRFINLASQDLAPLVMFRHLKYLKLGGMMQNYQIKIWQCVWLNPHLHTLVLSMSCNGEKLRSKEIRIARLFAKYQPGMRAVCQGLTRTDVLEKIPLARISLTNFVIDAEPFQWFDQRTLMQIELLECLDKGLILKAEEWKNTKVIGIVGQMKADLTSKYIVPS